MVDYSTVVDHWNLLIVVTLVSAIVDISIVVMSRDVPVGVVCDVGFLGTTLILIAVPNVHT